MRKLKRDEVILFLVPLAIVPIAMTIVRVKQKLDHVPQASLTATPRPAPTPTQPEPTSGRLLAEREGSNNSILPSPDGRVYYTEGFTRASKGVVHAWDVRTNKRLRSFVASGAFAPAERSLRLSPDGRTLFYTTGEHLSGVVLNTSTGREQAIFERPGDEDFLGGAIDNHVLAYSHGHDIGLRSLHDGRVVGRIAGTPGTYPTHLTFSSDGSLLAWVSGHRSALDSNSANHPYRIASREIVIYSMELRRRLFTWPLRNCVAYSVRMSGDNSKLVMLANKRIASSKRISPKPTMPATDFAGRLRQATSPPVIEVQDEIAPSPDDIVLVFSLKSGKQINRFDHSYATSGALAISPDGRWLAFRKAGDWLQIIDLSTDQVVARKLYFSHSIAFSIDSRELFMDNYYQRLRRMPSGVWKGIH